MHLNLLTYSYTAPFVASNFTRISNNDGYDYSVNMIIISYLIEI